MNPKNTQPEPTLTSRPLIDLNIPMINFDGYEEEEPRTHLVPDIIDVQTQVAVVENQTGSLPLQCHERGRRPRKGSARSGERPDWLPPNWGVEFKVRSYGATAGRVDRYYFDPVSGRKFRSRNEVVYFLETGSKRKKKLNSDADAMPSGSPGVHKPKKPKARIADFSRLNFDFRNPPENLSWVLTSASQDKWMPFGAEGMMPEPLKGEWDAAFSCVSQLEQRSRGAN